MKLTDIFERVVVLNLPFRTDRRERLERHLQEMEIADPAKVRWERAVCGDWLKPSAWWGAGGGAWGCLFSHVRVVQDAVADKIEAYCVLEDDVVFHERSAEWLALFVGDLPSDWAQIYLGGQHRGAIEQVPGHPFVVRPLSVNRTHCFGLRSSHFDAFHRHVLYFPDYFDDLAKLATNSYHIDHQLERAHRRQSWPVYAPPWWIAGQEAGDSDISGRHNPRKWWHPDTHFRDLPFLVVPDGWQPDERRGMLHAGFSLAPGTLRDVGLDIAVLSDSKLIEWAECIAKEAMSLWALPAACHPSLTVERLRSVWPGGALDLCGVPAAALRRLADYPANGLFPSPFRGF